MKYVRVGDVLRLVRRAVDIDPLGEYTAIGIRSFGKGVFHYPPTPGADLSKLRFFEVNSGSLVLSNIKAWEGAIAVFSDVDQGCVASNRFLAYVPVDDKIDTSYAKYFLLSDSGLPLIQRASPGSADRNRTLAIDRFENLVIPLPDLAIQRQVASRIDALRARVAAIAGRIDGERSDRMTVLYPASVERILNRSASRWEPIGEVADFVSDIVRPGEPSAPAEAFVGLQHVEPHTGRRVGQSPLGGEEGRKFRFRPGDVVYGYLRPYLNKVWVADMHGLCSVDQYVLRPKNGMSAEYLAHALRSRSTLDQAVAATHSLQLPRLRTGLLARIEIPIVEPEGARGVTETLDRMRAAVIEASDRRQRQSELIKALAGSVLNESFAQVQ